MKQRLLKIGVALALAAPIIWAFFRWAGGTLMAWIWYVFWHLNLVLRSLPQAVFWSLLLLAAVVIAVSSLLGHRIRRRARVRTASPRPGRVQQFARSIERADQAYYFKWTLARQVCGLIVDAVDSGAPEDPESRRKWWMQKDVDVPSDIHSYVQAGLWGGFWQREKPSRWRTLFRSSKQPALPLELDLETVVRFLEERLEVADERS